MGKINLTIEDFEDKKYGEGKRYTRFKTSEGWISSFDKPTIEQLKDSIDKHLCVEVLTDKNNKQKITKCYGDATDDDEVQDVKPERIAESKPGRSIYQPTSMYVSYAKDIFCELAQGKDKDGQTPKETMELSINLVKQAQKAFE